MSITFPTTNVKVPSGITALPSEFKRPGFGSLYGFDAQQGGGATPFENGLSGLFDGTNDYLTVNESSLFTTGDCTISLWFKSTLLPGSAAYDYMFQLTSVIAGGYDRAVGILGTGSDAQIVCNTWGSLGGWNKQFTNTSIAVDTWYHVVAVFTTGSAQVYLNGVDKGSKTLAWSTAGSYTETNIGGMRYDSANYFKGNIDEVSVFHSALSSTNITAIYNGGVPVGLGTDGLDLSPVGWWRCGDGTGDTDSGGGAPANTDIIGTVVNLGSAGSDGDMAGQNGSTYSSAVP
jgi:hypothetical protein